MESIWTIEELDAQIAAWKTALLNLSKSQEYTITTEGGSRRLTRADLPEVRNTLHFLQAEKAGLAGACRPVIFRMRPAR